MSNSARQFNLGTILSVTTGFLLTQPGVKSKNGISDLYEILNHVHGLPEWDSFFTHELPDASEQAAPHLLKLPTVTELTNQIVTLAKESGGLRNVEDFDTVLHALWRRVLDVTPDPALVEQTRRLTEKT